MFGQIFQKKITSTLNKLSKTEGLEYYQLPGKAIPIMHSWFGETSAWVLILVGNLEAELKTETHLIADLQMF